MLNVQVLLLFFSFIDFGSLNASQLNVLGL